ncbi:MAG: RdgB/HAM1 family non-canonical purine NTP pyrophosphatase [Deltaproteobacteria bacterium]
MDRLRRLVLATGNRGKLTDFRLLFGGSSVELLMPEDLGMRLDVEETGSTFEDNARLKACAGAEATGLATLADDSGLEVYGLGGDPGVRSARFAGLQCDDHENNMLVIKRLAELGSEADRRAAFVCSLVLRLSDGCELTSQGRCEGRIIDEERGDNGFGYDSIFFRDDLGYTFGQASAAEKNERSHRGQAVRRMIEVLEASGRLP